MNYELIRLVSMAAMLLDHTTAVADGPILFRVIARVGMPGFFLLLLNGIRQTSCSQAYSLRLCLFGMMAQPFYYLAFGVPSRLNILFTMSLVVVLSRSKWSTVWPVVGMLAAGDWLVGYSIFEGGTVAVMLLVLGSRFNVDDIGTVAFAMMWVYCWPNLDGLDPYWIVGSSFGLIALIVLGRGVSIAPPRVKWLGYWFYPVHLAILSVLGRVW